MIKIVLHAIGYAFLAFSVIGFIETGIGLATNKSYTLLKVIIYCSLFGIGLALL